MQKRTFLKTIGLGVVFLGLMFGIKRLSAKEVASDAAVKRLRYKLKSAATGDYGDYLIRRKNGRQEIFQILDKDHPHFVTVRRAFRKIDWRRDLNIQDLALDEIQIVKYGSMEVAPLRAKHQEALAG